MKLNLTKPIAFFDLETTGLDIGTARIVEISIFKVHANGKEEELTMLLNPEIPIPPETTLIHGISNDDVKDKPTFKASAREISSFLGNADLAGYNILRFDLPLLAEEFLRADIVFEIADRNIIDVQNIFHKMEPRTLSAAYKYYCNADLKDAHTAKADTMATYEVLLAQIEKYKDTPYMDNQRETFPVVNDMQALGVFSTQKKFVDLAGHIVLNDKNIPVFNFGKYKGIPVLDTFLREPQYFDWIQKSNFPEYTKRVCKIIYMQKFGNDKVK